MARTERAAIISEIEKIRGSHVICYLTSDRPNASAQMAKDALTLVFQHVRKLTEPKKLDVFLVTQGGDIIAAFGLAKLLREFAASVGALIADKCHSAGTLFVLGSNDVVMTKSASLSPIDPSIQRPLNPAVELQPGQRQLLPLSVESVAGFKDLVTEDWGIKGEETLSNLLKILSERVHPLALGDVFRARQQIGHLARKLLKTHRNDDSTIHEIVKTLTKSLGSHDYMIFRQEAREMLGEQVCKDQPPLEGLMWDLYQDFANEMQLGVPYDANLELRKTQQGQTAQSVTPGQAQTTVTQKLAIVESLAGGSDTCEKEIRLIRHQVQQPGMPIPRTFVQEEVEYAGWRHYT